MKTVCCFFCFQGEGQSNHVLYKKPGVSANQLLYRDFNKEVVYKALASKGETLKHLWQKYNAIGVVDEKSMSYRQYCRRYSEWADSKQLTFHIQRYPDVNLELDYAGKQLYLHNLNISHWWQHQYAFKLHL